MDVAIGSSRTARVHTCLWYCLQEARPQVQLVFLLRFAAGVQLGGTGAVPAGRVLLGACGWSAATLAVYVFNGVADRVEDRGNGSSRPIARGDLPVDFAGAFIAAAGAVAIAAAAVEGARQTLATAVYLLIGFAYSGPPFPLKRMFATASVSGAALGLVTYAGGAVTRPGPPGTALPWFALTMTVWMGAVGGIAKDLSDTEGDRIAGRRSWTVVFGERRARTALVVSAFLIAVSFAATALLSDHRLAGPALVLVSGAAALRNAAVMPSSSQTRMDRRRPYRVFMCAQYLSHLVLIGSFMMS